MLTSKKYVNIPKHCTMINVICTSHVYTGSIHNVVLTFKYVVFVFIIDNDKKFVTTVGQMLVARFWTKNT